MEDIQIKIPYIHFLKNPKLIKAILEYYKERQDVVSDLKNAFSEGRDIIVFLSCYEKILKIAEKF